MYQAVFFDLDGTLLPMDLDVFLDRYLRLLVKKLALRGYDPKAVSAAILDGTNAMIRNPGNCTNEEAFWNCYCSHMGKDARKDEVHFDAFYRSEFQSVQEVCGFAPQAAEAVAAVKKKGIPVILATNPFFPSIATHSRIRWAGLDPADFTWITTYDNSRHCKPNPDYYRDICQPLALDPAKCLMIGNDAQEDLSARQLGMDVFLLTDCLIDRNRTDLTQIPHGNFADLLSFLQKQLTTDN